MDIAQTQAQLQTEFADNSTGAITAQVGRNLIISAFGWSASRAPGVNDDNVDTAGTGSYFDTGSVWNDTSNGRPYYCSSGSAGAAVWKPMMYDGETAGGKLTGTYPNPDVNLAASDIPALPASVITSGTFAVGQIPGLPASIITSGTFSTSVLPSSVPILGTVSSMGQWISVTVTYANFAVATGLYVFPFLSLSAPGLLISYANQCTVAFAAPAGALSANWGTLISGTFSAETSVVITLQATPSVGVVNSMQSVSSWQLAMQLTLSGGHDLNTLTAGSVTFSMFISQLP